jgi:phosphate transport system substrate-binding protein
MVFTSLIIMLVFIPVISACQKVPTNQGAESSQAKISISGAFALYPMMIKWVEEYQKFNPGIIIDVSAGGAGKGMTDTVSGMVDIGMVSRDIKPEEINQGAFGIAVTKDAVFPTGSDQNPVLTDLMRIGVTKDIFTSIFIKSEITTWGQVVGKPEVSDSIHIYTRSDACGAAEVWAAFLGGKQEDLIGIGVSGDPGISEAISKDSLGLGYNNLNYAFDANTGKPVKGIMVIPIDINGNGKADDTEILDTKEKAVQAIANGQYPSPPARLLYLVTKGKPTGAVLDFILWILGEGQKYEGEVGYINLTETQLEDQKAKLK